MKYLHFVDTWKLGSDKWCQGGQTEYADMLLTNKMYAFPHITTLTATTNNLMLIISTNIDPNIWRVTECVDSEHYMFHQHASFPQKVSLFSLKK